MPKKPKDEEKKVPYTIWLDKSALDRLKVISKADDTPMASIARVMLMNEIRRWEERNGDMLEDRQESKAKPSRTKVMPGRFNLTVELENPPEGAQREEIRGIVDQAAADIHAVLGA